MISTPVVDQVRDRCFPARVLLVGVVQVRNLPKDDPIWIECTMKVISLFDGTLVR